MSTIYIQRVFRSLLVIGFIMLLIITGYFLTSLTYPFIIAWFIAFLINPLVNFLQIKAKLPRPLSVLLILIIIFAFIASLLTLLVAEVITGTEYLAKTTPDLIENAVSGVENWITVTLVPFINQLTNIFLNLEEDQQETILDNIREISTDLATSVGDVLQSLLTKLPIFLSWFPNAATVIIFSILATFFISNDWYRLKRAAGRFIPIKIKKSTIQVYFNLRKALFGYFRAQLTLISMTFVIVLLGLMILGINYALALSFIIALIDLLPYLGTGLIFVPWIVYQFLTQNISFGIGLLVLYVVIIVQRQLVEPKIVSSNIGVDPLSTLLSIFIGIQLFGFLGIIAGPIFAVLISTMHKAGVFWDIKNYILDRKI